MYFITNRYNLLEILSSGFLTPLSGFAKHYQDYLEFSPGRVPLFAGPLDPEWLEVVQTEDRETAFPVAVEIDLSLLSDPEVPTLLSSGDNVIARTGTEQIVLQAVVGVIPVAACRSVHFFYENHLREVTARVYENIDTGLTQFLLTPELIGKRELDSAQIIDWLKQLPPYEQPDVHAFQVEDRIGGAITMLSTATDGVSDIVEYVISSAYQHTPFQSPGFSMIPEYSWLTESLRPEDTKTIDKAREVDQTLFRVTVDVFYQTDRHRYWRPLEVLDQIQNLTMQLLNDSQQKQRLDSYFRGMADILKGERDFEGFKEGGLTVAKALLAVLIRPEPQRLLKWSKQEPSITSDILATAALFSGLLHGRKLLSVDLRNPVLDRRLATLAAYKLGMALPNSIFPLQENVVNAQEVEPTSVVLPSGISDSEPAATPGLVEKTSTVALPLPDTSDPEHSPAPGGVDKGAAVERMMGANLEENNGFRRAALELCRISRWQECVTTEIIQQDDDPIQITSRYLRKKVTAIEVPGFATVTHVLHIDRFLSRLKAESDNRQTLKRLEKCLKEFVDTISTIS